VAKNIKDLLVDATKFPTAIEDMLPEGAPKISETLTDIAGKIPAVPDFPVEIPDLPEVPTLPEIPGAPAGAAARVTPRPTARVTPRPTPMVARRLGEEILS